MRELNTLRVVIAFLVFLSFLTFAQTAGAIELRIDQNVIDAEVVVSREDQALGLGKRKKIESGKGMLFIYEEARDLSFWMKNMLFSIDMLWIRDGVIVFIHHDVPNPDPKTPDFLLPSYSPPEPADTVLEIKGGDSVRRNIKIGDRVSY